MLPVMTVTLREIEPSFQLPRRIGPHAVLRPASVSPTRIEGDHEGGALNPTHVLEIYEIHEREAILFASSLILAIRIASTCSVLALDYSFPDTKTLVSFEGGSIHVWSHHARRFGEDAASWIESHHEAIRPYINPEAYSRISNALRLYDASLHTRNADLALLGFVGALEGLFSIAPQELSFRLSLLIAKFLGSDSDSQRKCFEQIRDLYTVRSEISHGDRIDRNEEAAAIQIEENWTPRAEELARNSLRKIFENGLTETFNNRAQHEEFLINLLFEANLSTIMENRGSLHCEPE